MKNTRRMKRATLALLTVAAATSMASVAGAVPFGPNNLPPGLANQGWLAPGLSGQGGSPAGLSNERGSPPAFLGQGGLSSGGNSALVTLSTPSSVSSVREAGTSLFLLGIGLLALILSRRRLTLTSQSRATKLASIVELVIVKGGRPSFCIGGGWPP
jgi:hypothetical protein